MVPTIMSAVIELAPGGASSWQCPDRGNHLKSNSVVLALTATQAPYKVF